MRSLFEGGHYLHPRQSDAAIAQRGAPHILRAINAAKNAKHRAHLVQLAGQRSGESK